MTCLGLVIQRLFTSLDLFTYTVVIKQYSLPIYNIGLSDAVYNISNDMSHDNL